jgi:HAD superfamily hydrolase (TIGR01509 family)
MIAMPFDLVIFDCDGVLIDSELLALRAVAGCLAECGVSVPEEEILERYTGISTADMAADLEGRYGCVLPDFEPRERRHLSALFVAELRAVDGIESVLDSLSCSVCVASSGTPERLRLGLSCAGLYDRLSPHIFSATMVPRGKPAPDLFLYAAERMGIRPERCVVVEDSVPGVKAAVAAGMIAVGFTGGAHCRLGHDCRLYAEGAALVIDRMALLPSALLRLNRREDG